LAELPAPLRRGSCGRRIHAFVRGRNRYDRQASGHSRPAAGHYCPQRRGLHNVFARYERRTEDHHCREVVVMTTTDQTSSIEELNPSLKEFGSYEFGWRDADDAGADARRGLNDEVEIGRAHV